MPLLALLEKLQHTDRENADLTTPLVESRAPDPRIEIRRHKRARNISLRIDSVRGCVILTLPRWTSEEDGMAFVHENKKWIEKKLRALPVPLPLPHGESEKTLRRRARMVITELAHDKAGQIGKTITGISIRDTTTRWGSCSPDGRLNFSWRLLLAPPHVLDYVVAHEVAHLKHLNHSKRFWSVCKSLCDGDMDEAKKWLRDNGDRLLRYG